MAEAHWFTYCPWWLAGSSLSTYLIWKMEVILRGPPDLADVYPCSPHKHPSCCPKLYIFDCLIPAGTADREEEDHAEVDKIEKSEPGGFVTSALGPSPHVVVGRTAMAASCKWFCYSGSGPDSKSVSGKVKLCLNRSWRPATFTHLAGISTLQFSHKGVKCWKTTCLRL